MLPWMRARRIGAGVGISAFLAVALAIIFATAAFFAVHCILRQRAEELRSRSLVYAAKVADTVPTWAAPGETPDLEPLARYAVVAGLLYIQVVSGDEVLLETTSLPEADELLAEPVGPPLPRVSLRTIAGRQLVDVTVFYAAQLPRTAGPSLGPYAAGRMRLGLDASSLAWAATNTQALAAGLAALAWIASSLCVGFWLRSRQRGARPEPETAAAQAGAQGARVMRAGSLALYVDEARLGAGEGSIRLTPKQLSLLIVLMSAPGRTFSDEEILTKAWPGSPYADSRDVKQCVYLIRQRLSGAELAGDRILVNVPGVGYRIDPAAAGGLVGEPVDSSAVESRPEESR